MAQATSGPSQFALPEGEVNVRPVRWVPLELDISTEFDEVLHELARQNNHTVGEVLLRAVALYYYLSNRVREGKRVGVAREGQDLEAEITGF
jgi:hypothetical protein